MRRARSRALAAAGARNRTNVLPKPRVETVARKVIAEVSAVPVPTASEVSKRAANTQKIMPRMEVRPVPRMSAYALRRMGSRRCVAKLAAIRVVVISARFGDADSINLKRRRT
jgi:hypothetical protein